MEKKNILIVGNSLATLAFVKKLKTCENIGEIYVTGKNVDIRDDKVEELLSFVLENDISLTVVASKNSIKADIASIFNANGQMIFAPDVDSAKNIVDHAFCKKFLYKLRIPTSKFGIFEKAQLALDYLKTANFPLLIKSSEPATERDLYACPTVSVANIAINDLFFKSENKIVIEEYIQGHRFTCYCITDGYKALPLGIVETHKFSDCKEGGYLTKGSAAIMPDNFVTNDIIDKLFSDVIYRILNSLADAGNPYLGILGLNCVLHDDTLYVESLSPFLEDADAQVVLNSIEDNIISIMDACVMGVFADDYDFINTNDLASISLTLFARDEEKEITLIDDENINLYAVERNGKLYTRKGAIANVTASAMTLSRAKLKLADEIDNISFASMKYRKDLIC